jgi:hypothetical protein
MPETMGRKVLRRLTWHGDVRGRKDTDLAWLDTGESEPYGPIAESVPTGSTARATHSGPV